MNDTLALTTNEKRIAIVRDDVNVGAVVFNPDDMIFAERFYRFMGELQRGHFKEFEQRANVIDTNQQLDNDGFPVNTDERASFLEDFRQYMREQIDILFGVGTSQMVFGDGIEPNICEQFLQGVAPYIQKARASKVQQYTTSASAKRNKRKR